MIPRPPLAAHPETATTPVLGTGRAHGKAILLGEHSVVYGAPAIAVPVEDLPTVATLHPAAGRRIVSRLYQGTLRDSPEMLAPVAAAWDAAAAHVGTTTADTALHLHSELPIARGLGSSAAVAAAVVRAVVDAAGAGPLDAEREHALIQEAERAAHGTPSGIDARTVVADGPIRFERGEIAPLPVAAPFTLVVADTGLPGHTAAAVASVRALREREPRTTGAALDRLAGLAEGAAEDLATGDRPSLGGRLDAAHQVLRDLGVSSAELDVLVIAAQEAGALGAKLTGGGQGGCLLALAPSAPDAQELARALTEAGAAQVWTTTIGATA